jgi:transcriptional regulator NrdR family protein
MKRKNKNPDIVWNEELGVASCYLTDKYENTFVGTAVCHPDEADFKSEKIGCEIACARAEIDYLRYVKNYEIAKEIKTLKHFLSTIEQSKKYNPDLYENKMLRKAIENKELEYESVKEMINQKENSLNDYLKTKAVLHEKLRKMRAAKEDKID